MTDVLKQAPSGQFRVVGKDCSSDPGWLQGDYLTLHIAQGVASRTNGGVKFLVYDDGGQLVFPA